MPKIGQTIRLDGLPVRVSQIFAVDEGGDDGDNWEVCEVEGHDGARWYLEIDGEQRAIFRPLAAATTMESVSWHYRKTVKWTPQKEAGAQVVYQRGMTPDGNRYLQVGENRWQMEDYLVRYGKNDGGWLARASTPAAALTTFSLGQQPPPSTHYLGWAIMALLASWGLADAFFRPLGFGWGLWILGVLALIVAIGRASRPTLCIAAAFATWLFTQWLGIKVMAFLSPAQAQAVWFAALLVLYPMISLFAPRIFYVLADGAAKAGATTVTLHTVGLAVVCLFDEDWSWFSSWQTSFSASYFTLLYLAIWTAWLAKYHYDYRKVPLSERGFNALRNRVCKYLGSDNPLKHAQAIGDGIDDLADAAHLSDDQRVRVLGAYDTLLDRAATVFRALATAGISPTMLGDLAQQVQMDCAQLSTELQQMGPEGKGIRLSPCLQMLASDHPEKESWIALRKGRSQHGGYR